MADPLKRLQSNITGEFFVDSTCINCDTCRQLAPHTFKDTGEYSSVYAQPSSEEDEHLAVRALLCCPTGSIGGKTATIQEVMQDFPLPIENSSNGHNIYYCGFNSPKSYGGSSYFLQEASGNWLIDSPKFLPHLVRRFKEMGGIKYIFLTHRDDVAEADKYAKEFNAKRIIHEIELSAQPNAEVLIKGMDTIDFQEGFKIIPTPGHTQGHCVLLYKDKYLFSGDHLWWSRYTKCLSASKRVCWYSWEEQIKSMEKLLGYDFVWVLPGHGQRIELSPEEIKKQLQELVQEMTAKL